MENEPSQSSTSPENKLFDDWMDLQSRDLSELLESLNLNVDNNEDMNDDSRSQLIEKNIQHFKDYVDQQARLARAKISAYYVPAWCSSMEYSLLWIGGCRPSIYIRLVYGLCGFELESHIGNLTDRLGSTLAKLSASQLTEVDKLQRETIRAEDKLSTRLASFHEDIADQPLLTMAKKASQPSELNDHTSKALDEHEKCVANVLEEADQLRINTLKEMINILTPKQAVDFLAMSKKLHFCVHAWGQKRDAVGSDQEKIKQK